MLSDDFVRSLYHALIELHIVAGCLCIILFWVSVWRPKGTFFHVINGRLYLVSGFLLLIPSLISSYLTLTRPAIIHPDSEPYLVAKLSLFTIFLGITVINNIIMSQQFIYHKNALLKVFNPVTVGTHSMIVISGLLITFLGVINSNYILILNGLAIGFAFPFSFYQSYRQIKSGRITSQSYIWFHVRSVFHSALSIHLAFFLTGFMRRYFPQVYEHTGMALWYTPLPLAVLLEFVLIKKMKAKLDP